LPVAQNENQAVLDLLQNFNGLPSLKKLQAHLNMDREDAPISRREWKEATQSLLETDPVITASVGGSARELFGEEQSFKVIYCRLASPELLLTHERAVVTELLGQYPYALFVFSDQAQKRFHFLNVKDEPQGQKRRLFRRITVGNGERLRTAAEQLAKLDGEVLKRLPLSGIQARFDEAFDVGPVTKRFFAEYKRIFELVKAGIQGFAVDPAGEEARNLFTQRLFNRLMFLAFIQKKSWLKYEGNADYLCTLWTAHQHDTFANKGSFYEGRLKPLFFLGLNTGPSEVNLVGINRGGGLRGLIGDVPYLNGGLFEKDADDDDARITVTDAGLDAVINDLFENFNFTITESTPLDIEVAVDPEMLGKIFEELVTGRHESGSYYTPKPIVSFMCREALKGYLETQVASESKKAIARFVDRHEPDDIADAENVLNALRRVTVCDPACGSGAYLLGMLHELLDLRESLFKTKKLDHEKVYDRKLEIIQTNIYGVDIAEFAVNIARLRLWLSLAVDFGGNKPQPLPNLDYKIELGDSLNSAPPKALQMGIHQPLIDQALKLKREYLGAHLQDKISLRTQIGHLRQQVCELMGRNPAAFDWIIDFAEVFVDGGFDIIVANPPYISGSESDKIEGLRDRLRSRFETATGNFDIFIPFYELSAQLTKTNGWSGLITPNKVLSADYALRLRRYLTSNCRIESFLDASRAKPFGAAVYPIVVNFSRRAPVESSQVGFYLCTRDQDRYSIHEQKARDYRLLVELPQSWSPLFYVACEPILQMLRENNRFSHIATVRGAATVAEAYEIKVIVQEGTAASTQGRLLVSGNINRFTSTWGSYRTQYIKSQYAFPVVPEDTRVLSKVRLYERSAPKVVVSGMARYPKAFCDETGEYMGAKSTVLLYDSRVDLFYLCALLNSRPYAALYRVLFESLALSGGYMRFGPPQIGFLPARLATAAVIESISSAARQLQHETRAEERELLSKSIDGFVMEMYGITEQQLSALEDEIESSNVQQAAALELA
jgi:hypothetical protein